MRGPFAALLVDAVQFRLHRLNPVGMLVGEVLGLVQVGFEVIEHPGGGVLAGGLLLDRVIAIAIATDGVRRDELPGALPQRGGDAATLFDKLVTSLRGCPE